VENVLQVRLVRVAGGSVDGDPPAAEKLKTGKKFYFY
jgi:hypothetical protein